MLEPIFISVEVRGTINDSELHGNVEAISDPNTGVIQGELIIKKLPRNYAVIASSGLSWWCNSNHGSAKPLNARQKNLLELADFNYDLYRRNEFPDGSAIDMNFKVRRVDSTHVKVVGEWKGNYTLPVDIVAVDTPIIEEMEAAGDGKIKSKYLYTLTDSAGKRYTVVTPSEYTFVPISLSVRTLDEPQSRIMFFGVTELEKNMHYRAISQSTIIATDSNGINSFSAGSRSVPVRFG